MRFFAPPSLPFFHWHTAVRHDYHNTDYNATRSWIDGGREGIHSVRIRKKVKKKNVKKWPNERVAGDKP